jgi:hypothetical protein
MTTVLLQRAEAKPFDSGLDWHVAVLETCHVHQPLTYC